MKQIKLYKKIAAAVTFFILLFAFCSPMLLVGLIVALLLITNFWTVIVHNPYVAFFAPIITIAIIAAYSYMLFKKWIYQLDSWRDRLLD